MYTLLAAAAKVPEKVNMDYYIAIVTIFPVLMLTSAVLADFAKSFSPEAESKLPFLLDWIVSFFYNFTPFLAALGTIIGILALMFRWTNAWSQWFTFGLLVGVISFVATASYVYLRAVEDKRQWHKQQRDTQRLDKQQGDNAAQGREANGSSGA
jgi:hypothetical protein